SDRAWIAAVLAADADLQIRLHAATALGAEAHQLAHAVAVQHLKRIFGHDLVLDVSWQKSARVVAAEAKCCLREVVGTARKETSGTMISSATFFFSPCVSHAASKIARHCMRVTSGNSRPRRQPRNPSIGLASRMRMSWRRSVRFSSISSNNLSMLASVLAPR